jgi:aryl-alcohol dehydrogenase-like predicted oxidoreductase
MSAPPEGSRIEKAEREGWSENWSAYNRESTWKTLDCLHATAKATGHSPAQVAINWLLRKPGVTAPIIGARNVEQLKTNLASVGWKLSAEQVAELDRASEPELPYPYDFIQGFSTGRER